MVILGTLKDTRRGNLKLVNFLTSNSSYQHFLEVKTGNQEFDGILNLSKDHVGEVSRVNFEDDKSGLHTKKSEYSAFLGTIKLEKNEIKPLYYFLFADIIKRKGVFLNHHVVYEVETFALHNIESGEREAALEKRFNSVINYYLTLRN